LKLLMVTHFFDCHRGGIEIVAGKLASGLARAGAAVTWVATQTGPGAAVVGGGAPLCVPIKAANFTELLLGFPFPLPSPAGVARIWREARAADAVIVHDSLYAPCVAACLAAKYYGKPLMVVQHIGAVPYSNPVLRHTMTLANRLVAGPILSKADQVVFISEITARHFAGVKLRRPAEIVFNGVDTDMFHPVGSEEKLLLRRKLGLPVGKPIALFVGRFVEKKGLAILAHMARLRPDVAWVFAGWGPLDPSRSGLTNVHVLEGLSGVTLAEAYAASDVFVLPSVGEGFPLVIQEALACGLAVICSAETAGADMMALPYLRGVPVRLEDPLKTAEAFCAAVDSVFALPPSLAGDNARRSLAIDRYSWPSAIGRYVGLLRSLVTHPTVVQSKPLESLGHRG
jgi:glycosyltransferase involved in cell wall biosynthesis